MEKNNKKVKQNDKFECLINKACKNLEGRESPKKIKSKAKRPKK